jgi:hypothetical protein
LADGGEAATTPPAAGVMASSTWRWFMSLPWVTALGDISTARLTWLGLPIENGWP